MSVTGAPPAAGEPRPVARPASALLDAPILPAILRLSAPSVVLALCQTAVSIADTHFYRLLGGQGAALDEALRYSDLLFAGAVFVWLANTLASALRGSGNTFAPAVALVVAAIVCLTIGVVVAVYPAAWVGIFSRDAAVLETGSLYLRIVAPAYPLFAAGLALYFASQGAGRILLPMLAGTARLLIVLIGGSIVVQWGAPPGGLFAVIAVGLVTLGALTSFAVYRTPWQRD